MFPLHPILLVDDEEQFLASAEFILSAAGLESLALCSDSRSVPGLLAERTFSVIVLDLYMPHLSGLELLPEITREHPNIPVIILTAVNELETAVECMRNGAFDYIVKPVRNDRLVSTIRHALEHAGMCQEITLLRDSLLAGSLRNPEAFAEIITVSAVMRSMFQYVEAIAGTALPVLVTGETGSGKELFARAIHTASGRTGKFVTVNVAGVDDSLFSDVLFGHVRGAFTGAERDRKGLIEEAAGGTLFLDEIGDLRPESQVKLLRLIQEHTYYPLGSDLSRMSDARLVTATNRDLRAMQDMGNFRKDLYYRLFAHHIHIPPLRDRKEDLPSLVEHMLSKAARETGRKTPATPRELLTLLRTHHFPGNIRELEGMIFDAVSRHRSGVLSLESFREKLAPVQEIAGTQRHSGETEPDDAPENGLRFPEPLPTLRDVEDHLIREALRRSQGNQTIAAQLLGISRNTLNSRLHRAEKEKDERR